MVYDIVKIINQKQQTECVMYDRTRRRNILINIYDYSELRENTKRLLQTKDISLKRKRLFIFIDHADLNIDGEIREIPSYIDAIFDILKSREEDRTNWKRETIHTNIYELDVFSILEQNRSIPYIIRIRPENPLTDNLMLKLRSITDRYSDLLACADEKREDQRRESLKARLKIRERMHKDVIKRLLVNLEWNRYMSNLIGYFGYSVGLASSILGLFNYSTSSDQLLPYLGMYLSNNLIGFKNNMKLFYPLNHPLSNLEPTTRKYYSDIFDIIFRYISENRNGDMYIHVYGPQLLRTYMERYVKELKKQAYI